MKKILLLIAPIIMVMLAFRPVNSHSVSGTITDDSGNPVPGVTIKAKGTSTATSSTTNGKYTITLADKNGTLIFSAIGFQSKEVRVKGRYIINVSLSASQAELQEVVVTAYGTANRKTLSYSTSTIKTDELEQSNAGFYSAPLVGKVSGLSISRDKGYNDNDGDGVKEDFNTEGYDHITENRFLKVTDNPLSTFSIDVDAASYSN